MNIRKNILGNAIFLACGALSTQAQAVLPAIPVLNFDSGVTTCTYYGTCFVKSGSYFGMDTNGNGAVTPNERTAIVQNTGLILGTSQAASGSHGGAPDGSESAGIDSPWSFFGNTGLHYTATTATVLAESGNTATVNFAGWGVTWNGIPAIDMGSGAWEGNPNSVANITCGVDCSDGDTFTLDYSATVPAGDPSGFGNVLYNLHMVGTIVAITNIPPVTTSFNWYVLTNQATSIDLAQHVTDSDDSIDVTSAAISNPSANIASNCTPASITNNGDGTVAFPTCPDGTYTFDFTFADSFATSNTSTVSVVVSSTPAPNAINDLATTPGTEPVVIDVLANDIDMDGNIDATTVAVTTPAANGATSINASTGAITYTANAGFTGTDTFTYTVDDLSAQTSGAATVTVNVNYPWNTPASSSTYAPGSLAQAVGSTTGIVTAADIGVADTGTNPEDDILRSCIGGCFDFTLSGLTPGASATVILPLSEAIPVKADPGNTITYRKLINGSWVSFTSTPDSFRSAPGTVNGSDVSCPPATSIEYVGLTAGHRCLRLSITDGGPNDADGLADGSIADPGGLGEITRVVGTDGCSMTGRAGKASEHADWWLLAGLAMLGWLGVKRRKA